MDRLSVYAKSLREGSVSIILASVLLFVAGLVQVTPSRAAQGGDDAMMRHLVQYFMRVGRQQYERGYYAEAEKTFQMAQGYTEFLEPLQQRTLASFREEARVAAVERKRALEVKQTADALRLKGDRPTARAHLEQIRDNEFLTEKERAEVVEALRGMEQSSAGSAGAVGALGPGSPVGSSAKPQSVEPGSGETLDRRKDSVADLYYESVKAYHSGDLKRAREGFSKVLRSGLMPVPMAKTIRAYLGDIEATEAKQGNGRPIVLADEPAEAWSAVGTTALTNAPANFRAPNTPTGETPQGETERIEQLYNRSWEQYSQGELVAARRGFVEVAESGLFTAPPGKRPEDYIATIDRLLASSPEAVPPAAEPPAPEPVRRPIVEPTRAPLAAQEPAPEGTGIEAINRRRNIIRTYVESVVNDAVNQAERLLARGEFDAAAERVGAAQRVVNENQLYLGDELYRRHTQRLNDVARRNSEARTVREKQLDEQKRLESADAQRRMRGQAEIDRQQRIDELLLRAKAYWKQQQYEAAVGQLEGLLAIDPLHDEALTLKQMVEDMIYLRKQLELGQESAKAETDIKLKTEESLVPHPEEISYPKEWREIMQKPTRQPDKPFQLDPENTLVYERLEQIVDLSVLSPEMPISEAVEVLRNSVSPPLNIVMLWRDLLENADIESSDPINMDGLANVRLGTALENLISAISNPLIAEVDYVVNRGVITVATIDGLPRKKMETRVYEVADLVGEPANYFQQGAMRGMMGMMGGGMMGGGRGGMWGGMGGGMMGGGGGGYMSIIMAQSLRQLIQESIDPESWYDLYPDTAEGTIMVFPNQSPKKLAVYQSPEVHRQIEDLLNQLRRALGHEVAIEARFLVVTENFLEDIGLDLNFTYNFGGKWGIFTFDQGSADTAASAQSAISGSLGGLNPPAMNVAGGYGSILDDLMVTLLIRATQGRTDSKTLAAPKVTVLSGESASFSLSDYISYALPPEYSQSTIGTLGGGVTQGGQSQNVGFVTVGSTLAITPTISKDKKYVLLNVVTSQNDLLRFRTHTVETVPQNPPNINLSAGAGSTINAPTDVNYVQSYQLDVPETEQATVMTRVSVPDRGTLLLGGHKLAAEVDKEVGVPVLSKIPLLGRLFTNRSSIRDQKILLILVKPTIILQEEAEQDAIAAMEEAVPGL